MTGIIDSNPNILGGKPIIKGTRIPIKFIFDMLGQGFSIDEILEEYPSLSKEMIKKIIEIGREVQDSLSDSNISLASFQES
jgi:uncharacterized protein (DUF433 family)